MPLKCVLLAVLKAYKGAPDKLECVVDSVLRSIFVCVCVHVCCRSMWVAACGSVGRLR
jgi:hypothetical protein